MYYKIYFGYKLLFSCLLLTHCIVLCIKKAETLQAKGCPIEILSENDFLELIDWDENQMNRHFKEWSLWISEFFCPSPPDYLSPRSSINPSSHRKTRRSRTWRSKYFARRRLPAKQPASSTTRGWCAWGCFRGFGDNIETRAESATRKWNGIGRLVAVTPPERSEVRENER